MSTRLYQFLIRTVDKHVPPRMQSFWNHEAGMWVCHFLIFTCPFLLEKIELCSKHHIFLKIYISSYHRTVLFKFYGFWVNNIHDVCLCNRTNVCSQNFNLPKSADLHEAPRGQWWVIINISHNFFLIFVSSVHI